MDKSEAQTGYEDQEHYEYYTTLTHNDLKEIEAEIHINQDGE